MSTGCGSGGGEGGGVVVEPVAGGEAAVEVFGPAGGVAFVVGSGAVAGGVGVEVVGVAPGGELGDFVVPHLGAGGVGGSGPVPPGEPGGWVAGEGVGEALAAHGDGGGDDVGLVGVKAVGVAVGCASRRRVRRWRLGRGRSRRSASSVRSTGSGWSTGRRSAQSRVLRVRRRPSLEMNSTWAVPVRSTTAMTVPMLSQSAALTRVPADRYWRWARASSSRVAASVGSV